MSKNLYRINKKSDLDEIMKNNFLKPICIIFVSKTMDKKLYDDIAITLKSLSKQLTYSMILIVDFDDFVDNLNFFTQMKENVPCMISYFKAKQIAICNEKDNFIPVMVSTMDQIHSSYVNKLMNAFNQTNQSNNQTNNQTNNQAGQVDKESGKNSSNPKEQETHKEQEKHKEQEQEEQEQEEEQEKEEQEEEQEEQEQEEEEEQEKRSNDSEDKKASNKKVIKETDDNTTEEIRLKKEKLKEIKRLKEMLNKGA